MNDPSRTQSELTEEISALKGRIQELERSEAEHGRAEEELRLSRQLLQLLINAGPDFFFLKDLDLRYQLVNSANATFFGLDEADILGRTDAELMPEGTAVACQESDRLAIREKRMVVTIEPVGDKFYETHKFPVVVADEIVGVAGIIRDVTDHKRTEEALFESEVKYRTIVENSLAGVYIHQDGLFRFVNRRFCEIYGYTYEDLVDRLGPMDMAHPKEKHVIQGHMAELSTGEFSANRFTHRVCQKGRDDDYRERPCEPHNLQGQTGQYRDRLRHHRTAKGRRDAAGE